MTTEAKPPNLIQKLATVMAAVHTIPKSGRNNFHNYDYATEADINAGVRKAMASAGVMLIPSVDKLEWREVQTKNGTERIATLTVRYTVTDGTEAREFVVIGEGQDKGDKATYKAMTGAGKYALLKLFLIPTGDDPEKDEEDEKPARQARPARKPEPKPDASLPPEHRNLLPHEALWTDLVTFFQGDQDAAKGSIVSAATKLWGTAVPPKATWTPKDCADLKRIVTDVPF